MSMELFGPVACLYKFKTEDEVVRLANETTYGLAAYVFSKDHSRLWRLGETIEASMIGANTTDVTSEDLPFGGITVWLWSRRWYELFRGVPRAKGILFRIITRI